MVVALDVGGSSIKAGMVAGRHPFGEVTITELDHAARSGELIERFVTAIDSLPDGAGEPIAIAVPDPFDHVGGVSMMRHKFAALHGIPLVNLLSGLTGRGIRTCNDAAAAVVGAAVGGAGVGHGRVLGITLGTGLGAAFVVGGRVVVEEAGLVTGDLYRRRLTSGGTADDLLSARAYVRRLGDGPDAHTVGAEFGRDLAEFLDPIVDRLDADVLVVGGGGIVSFDDFAPTLQAGLPVPVEIARLDRWAPLVGAAEVCFG